MHEVYGNGICNQCVKKYHICTHYQRGTFPVATRKEEKNHHDYFFIKISNLHEYNPYKTSRNVTITLTKQLQKWICQIYFF